MTREIKIFQNKSEIYQYIKKKYPKANTILIRGSTTKKPIKKFSDFDIEIWGEKIKKPYYEIAFFKDKPILISAYFYKYRKGKEIKIPSGVKIIYGKYGNKIKPDFSEDFYNKEEEIKRECQLVTDFLFKYLRSKNIKYLNYIQKRIK